MARQRFQHKVVTANTTLPFAIVVSSLVYILAWFVRKDPVLEYPYLFRQLITDWLSDERVNWFISYILFGLTGYVLRELTTAYSLLRIRTTFPVSFYFLLILTLPWIFSFQTGNIITLLFYLSLYFFFRAYQLNNPVTLIFYGMVFIGIISILFPQILFFLPILYWGIFTFKALSVKTFFAGLTGIAFPYWFLAGHAFFYDEMVLFYAPFLSLVDFAPIDYSVFGLKEILSSGLLLWLFLISIFYYFSFNYQDKIRTRTFLNFLILFGLALIVYGCLQPCYYNIVVQVFMPLTAILAGRLFAFSNTRLSNFFFLLTFLLIGGVAITNIWIL